MDRSSADTHDDKTAGMEREDSQAPMRMVPGDLVGQYKIISRIGEGGFGVVFLALQMAPVKRRVALKVVKPGMDTKAVIARFEAERQALALMGHPGIAKVFDAGATPDGRPYFVMEFVKGESITEYCDRHKLDTRARLRLFIKVCDAIQHAHQKGIIHRDLKPGNILVTIDDRNDPEPKVIDFGIAKATRQQLTEETFYTEQGQLIGTPEYMSPEQADLSAVDIDTRTDVYSLGVILYELLSGRLPFDPKTLRSKGFAEIQRILREQDPPKPSTRLTTLGNEEGVRIAEARKIRLDELASMLRRELEWIPLKALRKNRAERYGSVETLGDDVRRYLNGEPLEAGPESATYRLRKHIRRNKVPFIAAAIVMLILILGITITSVLAVRLSEQVRVAELAVQQMDNRTSHAAKELSGRRQAMYVGSIRDARDALRAGRLKAASDHVLQARTYVGNLEPFELGYLSAKLDDSLTIARIHSPVSALAVGLDGEHIFVSGEDGRIQQISPLSLKMERRLFNSPSRVDDLRFLSNGTDLLAASSMGYHRVVDTKTGQETAILGGAGESAFLSHTGEMIAGGVASSRSGRVLLWDTNSLSDPTSITFDPLSDGSDRRISGVSIVGGRGGGIAVGGWDGSLAILDLPHQGVLPNYKPRHSGSIDSMESVVVDGQVTLVTSSQLDPKIKVTIWETVEEFSQDARPLHSFTLIGHKVGVKDLAISPDSSRLASAGLDKIVRLWDLQVGVQLAHFNGHDGVIDEIAFTPDGQFLVSGSHDETVRLWPAKSQLNANAMRSGLSQIKDVAIDRSGQIVASCGSDGFLHLHDAYTWNQIRSYDLGGRLRRVAFSPNGSRLLVSGASNNVHVVDIRSNTTSLVQLEGTPEDIAWMNDSENFVVGTTDENRVVHANAIDGRTISVVYRSPNRVLAVAVHPSEPYVACGAIDGFVRMFDVDTGEMQFETLADLRFGSNRVGKLVFNPDGSRIYAGLSNGEIVVLGSDGVVLETLRGHDGPCNDLDLIGEGSRLVSVSEDSTLRIWDPNSNHPIIVLNRHAGPVNSLAVDPVRPRIFSASDDGTLQVWDARTARECAIERGLIPSN